MFLDMVRSSSAGVSLTQLLAKLGISRLHFLAHSTDDQRAGRQRRRAY
jgi:hypothetical protein